jgi:hypothetical protein
MGFGFSCGNFSFLFSHKKKIIGKRKENQIHIRRRAMKKEMAKEQGKETEQQKMAREKFLATLERKARKQFLADTKEYERCIYLQTTKKEMELIKEKMQTLEKRLRRLGTSSTTSTTSTKSISSTSSTIDFKSIAQAMKGEKKPKELGEKERKVYQKVHSYSTCFKSEAWGLNELSPSNISALEGWKKSTVRTYWEQIHPLL